MSRWIRMLGLAVAVSALQIAFLFSIIQGRAGILRDGAEVVLKVEPVDPRDLLRGDYVRLGYSISNLSRTLFAGPVSDDDVVQGTRVMVRLAPGEDGLWDATGARLADSRGEDLPAGEIEIAGEVDTAFAAIDQIGISYGIERFYLPEGEGKAIEHDMRVRPFRMLVAIGDDGMPQIKAFFDGEHRLYEEPLY